MSLRCECKQVGEVKSFWEGVLSHVLSFVPWSFAARTSPTLMVRSGMLISGLTGDKSQVWTGTVLCVPGLPAQEGTDLSGNHPQMAQSTSEAKLVLSRPGKPHQHLTKISFSQENGRGFYEILSVVISVDTVGYLPAFLCELTSCMYMLLPDVQWDVPFWWLTGMISGPMNWHGPLQKGPPTGCGWYVIWLLRGQVLLFNVLLTLWIAPWGDAAQI